MQFICLLNDYIELKNKHFKNKKKSLPFTAFNFIFMFSVENELS